MDENELLRHITLLNRALKRSYLDEGKGGCMLDNKAHAASVASWQIRTEAERDGLFRKLLEMHEEEGK